MNFKFSFLFFSVLCASSLIAQTVAIETPRSIMVGLDCPILVVAENLPCESISISVEEHIVSGSACEYKLRAQHPGMFEISVYKTQGDSKTLISQKRLYARRFPEQFAKIGRTGTGGSMRLAELKVQQGLVVPLTGLDMSGSNAVKNYKMNIIRNGEVIGSSANIGARFEAETLEELKKVKAGDILFFEEIEIRSPGTKGNLKLADLSITIF